MASKGFLLVLMQPPPAFEEEFNAWYDSEHIPERLSVPGFVTGLRYVCVSGHPRYLALYDLESYEVLRSPAYLNVAYDRSSPWTKRVTGRVKVWRYAGHQVVPGSAVTQRSARLQLLRFPGVKLGSAAELGRAVEAAMGRQDGIIQTRVLVHDGGPSASDHLVVSELRTPHHTGLDVAALGAFAGALDLVNDYAPY
jgi:hypothetical protein